MLVVSTTSVFHMVASLACALRSLLTHVLELLVSSVVGDLLAQVDEHVVARVIGGSQQLLHLPAPLLVPHLIALQHGQHLICRPAQDVTRLHTAPWGRGVNEESKTTFYPF